MTEWQPSPDYKEANERVVCAACRDDRGIIVTGARHLDSVMRNQIHFITDTPTDFTHPDNQGFINQWGQWLSREEAHVIATKRGQIIRRCGGDEKTLYSENLY